MSDLDAALQPLREFLERRAAEGENGTAGSESVEKLVAAAAALQQPETANGSAGRVERADWALYERNRAEIRQIVEKLRNGGR